LQRDPALLDNLKKRRNVNDPQSAARVLADLSPGRQPSLWSKLYAIQAPVLLMAGALDNQYLKVMNEMAALIPQARLMVAPGAGHNIHIETPELFVKSVKSFLDLNEILA
jgi:2-succinyl-6-hydroxy-2,4-cyclohexadiene-1-carboxylate synthase